MSKILILGGCGFLGTYLSEELKKNNKKVYTLCRSKHSDYNLDLRNIKETNLFFRKNQFDKLINLVSVGMGTNNLSDMELFETNVNILNNILNSLEINKINETLFFHISSSLVGSNSQNFESYYSYTKYIAEQKIISTINNRSLTYPFLIRIGNTYSEKQPNNQLFKSSLLSLLNKNVIKLKYPNRKRNFLYAGDVINNLTSIINSDYMQSNYFSITSSKTVSIYNFVKQIAIELNLDYKRFIEKGKVQDNFHEQYNDELKFVKKFCLTDYKLGIKKSINELMGRKSN